jgi:excisionase family DNA binding protein
MEKEKLTMEKAEVLGDEILSFKKASQFLGVSLSWLYKLCHFKKIPHYKPNGKMIYFKKSDLNTWLLRNRVSTQEEIEQKAVDYVTSGTNGKQTER